VIYAVFFGLAILGGWVISARHVESNSWRAAMTVLRHGNSELRTMCILTAVWIATVFINWWTGDPYPISYYIGFDVAAIVWLLWNQTKDWQWIIAALFTAMLLTHLTFIVGVSLHLLPEHHRPAQDILAVLGYAQIFSVGTMALQRRSHVGAAGGWGFGTDWVLVRRLRHAQDADA